MIINNKKYLNFENDYIASEVVDVEKNFKIFESLYEEAVMLGSFKSDKLEIDTEIEISRVINSVQNSN